MESYQTWMHLGHQIRNRPLGPPLSSPSFPTGWGDSPLNGIPEYTVLTWHVGGRHRRWETSDDGVRELQSPEYRGGPLPDMTVAYCAYVFADLSVRWVKGTRIGWP